MNELDINIKKHQMTTAEIIYHMPDHPRLLQVYVWQELDVFPHFPELKHFLEFWEKNLDGRIHSVNVMHAEFFGP